MRWFTFLWRWLQRVPPPRPDLHVLVYTRHPCPLCDEAAKLLLQFQRRYGFHLETQDVDAAEELQHKYGNCVPVVLINHRLRFRGHVNPVLLQRILDTR